MNNWQASGKPQEKSRKTPRKHQEWLRRHKLLVQRLREGINVKDPARDSGVLFWRLLFGGIN